MRHADAVATLLRVQGWHAMYFSKLPGTGAVVVGLYGGFLSKSLLDNERHERAENQGGQSLMPLRQHP